MKEAIVYPEKPLWRSKWEKRAYGGMVVYSCLVIAYILQYYTWGGQ